MLYYVFKIERDLKMIYVRTKEVDVGLRDKDKLGDYQERIKSILNRGFDITVSIFFILLFSPIYLIVAIWLFIDSPKGGFLFKQKRLGLNGKEFSVYKFRTMVPNAEKILEDLLSSNAEIQEEYLTYRKLKKDPRIIKGIGKILRSTSIDEVPQFFNILFGDMSIVGPRPYMKAEFYNHPAKDIEMITSVKPGVTGLWQVQDSRHSTTFNERVEMDKEYIKTKNLWLDIKIMLKTGKVMLGRKGA